MDRFAALADTNRRRIIELIAKNGEMTSTEISNEFQISAPAVSQHLKVLRESGVLEMKKNAQQRIYSINSTGIDEMWEWLNTMRQYWNERFDALDEILTKDKKQK